MPPSPPDPNDAARVAAAARERRLVWVANAVLVWLAGFLIGYFVG